MVFRPLPLLPPLTSSLQSLAVEQNFKFHKTPFELARRRLWTLPLVPSRYFWHSNRSTRVGSGCPCTANWTFVFRCLFAGIVSFYGNFKIAKVGAYDALYSTLKSSQYVCMQILFPVERIYSAEMLMIPTLNLFPELSNTFLFNKVIKVNVIIFYVLGFSFFGTSETGEFLCQTPESCKSKKL